jgi:hypothetical protein
MHPSDTAYGLGAGGSTFLATTVMTPPTLIAQAMAVLSTVFVTVVVPVLIAAAREWIASKSRERTLLAAKVAAEAKAQTALDALEKVLAERAGPKPPEPTG